MPRLQANYLRSSAGFTNKVSSRIKLTHQTNNVCEKYVLTITFDHKEDECIGDIHKGYPIFVPFFDLSTYPYLILAH